MPGKKRVLILYADAGFGHKSAAKAIAAALEESHGNDCECSLVNPLDNEKTLGWLRDSQSDYDKVAREMPELYKFGYDLSDGSLARRMMENGLRVLLFRTMREILKSHNPDVVISTYPLYQAPLDAVYSMTRAFVPTICVVTDLTSVHSIWFSKDADLTVVPTPIVRELALDAGLEESRIEIIGIPVHPGIVNEKRDKKRIREELGWDTKLTTLLAVGSKRVSGLPATLNALNHSGLPLQLIVVAGGDDKLFAELSGTEWHLPVKLYNFVSNMPSLMKAADCMVSKAGGLIVSESLAAGLPMLLVDVLPGQEVGNAEYVVKGGAGEMATEPIKALEAMRHWLLDDGRLLEAKAMNAARIGRPRAAFDIVDRAWDLALRRPERKDLLQIEGIQKLKELFGKFNVPIDE